MKSASGRFPRALPLVPWVSVVSLVGAGAILGLFSTPVAGAATKYRGFRIIRAGYLLDPQTKATGNFKIGALNDQGMLVFVTDTGAVTGSPGKALVRRSEGSGPSDSKFYVIPPRESSEASARNLRFLAPVSMNKHGDIVFGTYRWVTPTTRRSMGVYLWESGEEETKLIAGRSATVPKIEFVSDQCMNMGKVPILEFIDALNMAPVINFDPESEYATTRPGRMIAFAGQISVNGVLQYFPLRWVESSGKIEVLCYPTGQPPSAFPIHASINDAGAVAFVYLGQLLTSEGRLVGSAKDTHEVVWDSSGAAGYPTGIGPACNSLGLVALWVHSHNDGRDGLAIASCSPVGSRQLSDFKLFRWTSGTPLMTSVLPNDGKMPGGGTFQQLLGVYEGCGISFPNEKGEHAMMARVEEDSMARTAAYLLKDDDSLELILKQGDDVEGLGKITEVVGLSEGLPAGIAINNVGQVALAVRIEGGLETIVLLTPKP
jgi:hypothetical protein